jgi:chromosome partitioning protein
VWAAKDIIDIVKEFSIPKPNLETRFVINRLFPNTMLGAEVKEALGSFDVEVLANAIRNRTEYAKAARAGLTALETEPNGQASREVRAVVEEISALLNGAQEGKLHVAS